MVPGEPAWRLTKFLTELDDWADREGIDEEILLVVLGWIMGRMEDPYQGVHRATGFENLWHGRIPDTYDPATGRSVTCSYWINELDRTVRLDNFGLQ